MNVTTKVKYGLRLLIYIGAHAKEKHIQLKEIAKNERISIKYLEQIIQLLKSAGLVQVTRGSKGGYRPVDNLEKVSLRELYVVLEGTNCFVSDDSSGNKSKRNTQLVTKNVWEGLNSGVNEYLESIKMGELINEYLSMKQELIYYI